MGTTSGGRRGPKPGCPPEVIRDMYEWYYLKGMTFEEIAGALIDDGTRMPRGGQVWDKSSVRQKMYSAYGQEIGAELGLLGKGRPVRKAITPGNS